MGRSPAATLGTGPRRALGEDRYGYPRRPGAESDRRDVQAPERGRARADEGPVAGQAGLAHGRRHGPPPLAREALARESVALAGPDDPARQPRRLAPRRRRFRSAGGGVDVGLTPVSPRA